MNRIHVKPAPGLVVRDPDRDYEPLPSEGKAVPRTAYWLRRISCGDCVEVTAPRPARKAAAKATTVVPATPAASKED